MTTSTRAPSLARRPPAIGASARAVAALELRVQARDPVTTLYALVYLFLAFGFASSDAVDLVGDGGALPRTAPLALALATGGLTAFGQVITTMVTASAFLRDAALRVDGLLFASPMPRSAWVLGRWGASVLVLAATTLAIPLGLVLGRLMPWVPAGAPAAEVAIHALRAWAMLAFPTGLVVASVLALVAVVLPRLLAVLGAALALLFLWQGTDALRDDARLGAVAAAVDPFGTTPLQRDVAGWEAAARATRPVPFAGALRRNRITWGLLACGAVAAAAGIAASSRSRSPRAGADGVASNGTRAAHAVVAAPAPSPTPSSAIAAASTRASHGAAHAAGRRPDAPLAAIAAFTLRWTWRDRGWLAIAALGALNVAANVATLAPAAAPAGTIDAGALLHAVHANARLFCILLATIYAGELVWRDRDARLDGLVDATPVATRTLVLGRLAGIVAAEAAVVALLALAALLAFALPASRHGVEVAFGPWIAALVPWLLAPFVHWTVLSLAVHAVVQHKVAAHLLLIAGWVVAVGLDAGGVRDWRWRFADPPALTDAAGLPLPILPFGDAWMRTATWSVACVPLAWLAIARWRRGAGRPRRAVVSARR